MKKLIIVESPTKARTITKFLKDDATVLASMGHIREIPENGMNVDLNTFVPNYVISNDKKDIVKKMKSSLKAADELYLATDEDREGESISYHIVDILKPSIPTKRMVFHEITRSAILNSLENTREIDMDMVNAQEARRVLDRLFGFKVSPLLWKYLSSNHLSAGRVQTPTLRLIVDREYKRLAFVSSKYNIIKALFSADGVDFEMNLSAINGKQIARNKDFFDTNTGELLNEDCILLDDPKSEEIIQAIRDFSYRVSDVQKKDVRVYPPVPFITSTLQQEANNIFHFSAKETMKIAQELYEKGLITYMRTDSPTLSKDGVFAARRTVESVFTKSHLSDNIRIFKSKDEMAQEAHEAIRPAIMAGGFKHANELALTGKSAMLYDLIFRRTLASQMRDNLRISTTLSVENEDGDDTYTFTAKGSIDVELGFKEAYNVSDNDNSQKLPDLSVSQAVELKSLDVVHSNTHPPKRWTEASLIKEIERLGIGRPSTYATIVSSLLSRGYVIETQNLLIPTFLGFIIIKFLENHLSKFIDYDFTSNMEKSLDEIENKKLDKYSFLNEFYNSESGLLNCVEFQIDDRKEELRILLPQIDNDTYKLYFGRFGAYILYGDKSFSLPKNLLPYQLTSEFLSTLVNSTQSQDKKGMHIANHPETGEAIEFFPEGRYGAYFSMVKDGKPTFVSLPKNSKYDEWTVDEIVKLFALPIYLGTDIDGFDVKIANGKYGPYISYKDKNIPYKNMHKLLSLSFEDAVEIVNRADVNTKSIKKRKKI